MHIPRIYINEPNLALGEITLNQDAYHHCVKVLRVKTGSQVILFNGLGGEYTGSFIDITKQQAIVSLEKFKPEDSDTGCNIHLVQGVSRKDRMHIALQKAVELGVSEITPILTEFSDVKHNPDFLAKKFQQWQAVVINACEQCGQTKLPIFNPIKKFSDWLTKYDNPERLNLAFTLLHPGKHLKSFQCESKLVTCVIGPEGGFSFEEEEALLNKNFLAASLGKNILRFETAATVAVAIAQHEWS